MAEEQANKETIPSGPKAPTEIVVRNPDGLTFSTRLKDEKGRFVKKQKTMPSSRELTRRGRQLLFKKVKNEKTGEMATNFDAMTQYMIDAATGKLRREIKDENGKVTEVEEDPKKIMAATQAYKVVCSRLLGKEPLSDEDREAQKDSNTIRFVLIQPPELANKSKEQLTQPAKPAFAQAQVVEQN